MRASVSLRLMSRVAFVSGAANGRREGRHRNEASSHCALTCMTLRTCARASTSRSWRLPLGFGQRIPAREQGAGPDGHRLHAGRVPAGRLAGRHIRRSGRPVVVAGRRLLRPEPAALLRGLHPARAALRPQAGPSRLSPPLARRPVLLLREFPLGRGADGLHADACPHPVRLGACRGDRSSGWARSLSLRRCAPWCWWRT